MYVRKSRTGPDPAARPGRRSPPRSGFVAEDTPHLRAQTRSPLAPSALCVHEHDVLDDRTDHVSAIWRPVARG